MGDDRVVVERVPNDASSTKSNVNRGEGVITRDDEDADVERRMDGLLLLLLPPVVILLLPGPGVELNDCPPPPAAAAGVDEEDVS